MLRKFLLLLGSILVVSSVSQAQLLPDKLDLSGGYSYMHFDSSPGANLNGFYINGEYKLIGPIGAVADFNDEYGHVSGIGSSVKTFLVGPQVSFPSRVSPFAHLLVGIGHYSSNSYSNTSFAWGVGFGIDDKFAPALAWRVIEFDYLPTHFGNGTQNNARLSTGIVIHF